MQPDFSKLFHTDKVAPLHFRVRSGACYVHDVQFLSSYLHDARFSLDDVMKHAKKLSIALNRDCWEFGYTKHVGSMELHIAKSRLTITPISQVRWEAADTKVFEQELWIEKIYLGVSYWEAPDTSELIISASNAGCKLRVLIANQFGNIRLDDLEMPYLYSARHIKAGSKLR
jgi:hypothetical protein